MKTSYDAVIVGAGHNGLVCGAYLARKGLSVCVVERRDIIGGAAVTEELWPGFHLTTASYVMSLLQPKVILDLDLKAHGFAVMKPDPLVQLLPDGRHLVFHDDTAAFADQLRQFSEKDAEALPRYRRHMQQLAPLVRSLMWSRPIDPTSRRPGDVLDTLKFAWRHRGAVSKFYELYDLFTLSAYDYLAKWFESDITIAALGFYAAGGGGGNAAYKTPGTAFALSRSYLRDNTTAAGGTGFVVGGMGAITKAIAASGVASGMEIRTGVAVRAIRVGNGRTTGVVLDDGDVIEAKAVVSNANARTTFLTLLPEQELPPAFVSRIRGFRAESTVFKVHLALDGLPVFRNFSERRLGFDYPVQLRLASGTQAVERSYMAAQRGEIDSEPFLTVMTPSLVDPSLAPAGKHVMSIFGGHVPNRPAGGGWDEKRGVLLDHVTAAIEAQAPGFRDLILHSQVLTPLDYERIFDLPGGHLQHGEMSLNQMFFGRPAPHYANYRTPIDRLYLCGASAHPGGGVTGIPGHNAAEVILRDFGR
ncbi:phytoene desaturase family protein [Ensifer soli]|uniref:phytoene desaturase family protein n=1 Tax=Ciceribacter sp. sgz301302 TaxID=3342379 RepID=UPI0035BB8F3F